MSKCFRILCPVIRARRVLVGLFALIPKLGCCVNVFTHSRLGPTRSDQAKLARFPRYPFEGKMQWSPETWFTGNSREFENRGNPMIVLEGEGVFEGVRLNPNEFGKPSI